MTPLDQYLERAGETTTAFAARVGCDIATISRIRRGLQEPALALAARIVEATGNRVGFDDLMKKRRRG